MGCIQSMIWNAVSCECPKHISLESLSVKPKRTTPLDRLGFPQRCCWCCSLRVASSFICFVSIIWATIMILLADRTMSLAFPDRDAVFKYCKLVYLLLCMVFLLTCGGLMFGIFVRKEIPILVYVWYGFIFNCMIIVLTITSTIASVVAKGSLGGRQVVRAAITIIWSIVFFYLLMVVNSYKLAVWYLTLGFGI